MFAGGASYWAFAGFKSVPKELFPYPIVVLIANGIICGFLAWVIHEQIVLRIVNYFGPKPQPPPNP